MEASLYTNLDKALEVFPYEKIPLERSKMHRMIDYISTIMFYNLSVNSHIKNEIEIYNIFFLTLQSHSKYWNLYILDGSGNLYAFQ